MTLIQNLLIWASGGLAFSVGLSELISNQRTMPTIVLALKVRRHACAARHPQSKGKGRRPGDEEYTQGKQIRPYNFQNVIVSPRINVELGG